MASAAVTRRRAHRTLKDTVGADHRALEVELDAYRHGVITYITC